MEASNTQQLKKEYQEYKQIIDWFTNLQSLLSPQDLKQNLQTMFYSYLETSEADFKKDRVKVMALYKELEKLSSLNTQKQKS